MIHRQLLSQIYFAKVLHSFLCHLKIRNCIDNV